MPLLLDFGIAKTFDVDSAPLTWAGTVIGTPHYMSPEQATAGLVDARSDLYSLGVVFYEMLTGCRPFEGSSFAVLSKHQTEPPVSPSVRRPDLKIPTTFEAIALRCLEKNPANRFQTADDLDAALATALALPPLNQAQESVVLSDAAGGPRRRPAPPPRS